MIDAVRLAWMTLLALVLSFPLLALLDVPGPDRVQADAEQAIAGSLADRPPERPTRLTAALRGD
jgi:hypothetical protein